MVLESENGKETVTFSTVSKPADLPEEKDRKEGRRGKEPVEVKRDQKRREAWLERKTVEERSVAEVPAASPVTEPAPVPAGGRTPAPSSSGSEPLVPGHPGLLGCRPPVGHPGRIMRTMVTRSQGGGPRKGPPKPFFLTPIKFVLMDGHSNTPSKVLPPHCAGFLETLVCPAGVGKDKL